ncbi:hypothetical protein [Acinetobacter indicus]|uniref:hypothetical protein n=1 Tax=Acinetobacter indicus TaxID=756892 RepID=UPI0011783751|nr:hypothetical protein [Acinetobacter indicus]
MLYWNCLSLCAGIVLAATTFEGLLRPWGDAHAIQTLLYQLWGGCIARLPWAACSGEPGENWSTVGMDSRLFHAISILIAGY